jgi:hypothetical protein
MIFFVLPGKQAADRRPLVAEPDRFENRCYSLFFKIDCFLYTGTGWQAASGTQCLKKKSPAAGKIPLPGSSLY